VDPSRCATDLVDDAIYAATIGELADAGEHIFGVVADDVRGAKGAGVVGFLG